MPLVVQTSIIIADTLSCMNWYTSAQRGHVVEIMPQISATLFQIWHMLTNLKELSIAMNIYRVSMVQCSISQEIFAIKLVSYNKEIMQVYNSTCSICLFIQF